MRLGAVAMAILLAACGSLGGATPSPSGSSDATPPTPSGEPDLAGTWRLTEGTGVPIVEDYPITLILTGTEIGGTSACNSYSGRLSFAGGALSIGDLGGTAMGCAPDVMTAEIAYLEALRAVSRVARDGDALVLGGPGVELRFDRLADPPTAELVDHLWVLETLVVGDVAMPALGGQATLELLSDGTFSGSTGCRTFEGEWVERGDQILATSMAMSEEACPVELQEQDSHIVSVVGDGFVPTIDGPLLTLTDPGSIGLVYRAAD